MGNNYPPPYVFGAPQRFTEWRKGQFEAIQSSLASRKRVVVHDAPPGFGKTMLVIGEMLMSGRRTLIDTNSKFLQDQYTKEFAEETGLYDIRGRSNYVCNWETEVSKDYGEFTSGLSPEGGESTDNAASGRLYSSNDHGRARKIQTSRQSLSGVAGDDNGPTSCSVPARKCSCQSNAHGGGYLGSSGTASCVAHAPCQTGAIDRKDCLLFAEGGCEYYDRIAASKWRPRVLTNYALNLSSNLHSEGLGEFPRVVWDEGHAVPQAISDAVKFELTEFEMKSLMRVRNYDTCGISDWISKSNYLRGWVVNRIDTAKRMGDSGLVRRLKGLKIKLDILGNLVNDRWVIEDTKDGKEFTPINPADYKDILINGASKILIVSATIRPKVVLDQLGFHPDDVDYFEYDCPFQVRRRPIYVLPTTRMNFTTPEDELRRVVQRADQIIARRLDRKGIIPTVSFRLQEVFLKYSMFKDLMICPKSGELPAALSELKRRQGPCVLVGPNFSTGVDLPHDLCRYVIVPKLPYLSSQNKVFKARCDMDRDYGTFMMVQELVQSLWRGMRSEEDWCEGFILDSNIENVLEYNRKMFQRWFLSAIICTDSVPEAMIL